MPSVLFVCTANRFRSPLAAAFFRDSLQRHPEPGSWHVDSAGTWTVPGLPALPEVVLFAGNHGLDLARHRSKAVTEDLLRANDLILVMGGGQQEALQVEFPAFSERIHLLSQAAEGRTYDIPDLADSAESLLEIGDHLGELIQSGSGNICRLAERLQRRK